MAYCPSRGVIRWLLYLVEKLCKDRGICNYNAPTVINDIFLNPFPVTLETSRAVHVKL